MEKKTLVRPLDIKALDEKGVFEGYGSVFGNTDSYQDVVMPGAFTKALSKKSPEQIKLLWQHDSSKPIGVYEEVRETSQGLYVKGRLLIDDVQQAKEAYALLKAKAVDGLSIGYTTEDYSIGQDKKRYLKELDPWEISVVTFPANNLAIVNSVKSEGIHTIRDFEKLLRDVGFSQREAVALASNGFKAIEKERGQREVEPEDHSQLIQSLKDLTNMIKGYKDVCRN